MAAFGFWFLVGQWSILMLLMTLLGIAGATGSLPFPIGAGEVIGWIAAVGVVLWFGRKVLRSLQSCRFVVLAADGAWILRDQLGRELARIGRDEPRQVEYLTQKVWSFGQSVKRWTRSYARIRTAQRVWETCRSIPKETRPAVERLLRPPFS
ncbi:MAG: hypothetical protein H6835_14390 [Planctomycetes bacterium]|nr:hypothetical protein [Planctomycetota bacterium]